MDYNEIPQHPSQRKFDLVFGLLFLALGGFRMFELYRGVAFSKFKIMMGVFMVVLGVFKLYAYLKTKALRN